MKIFYTGASKFEGIQQDPRLSLGGYISGSEIPNASLNNLFGEISKMTISQDKKEIRGIVIYNDGSSTLTGLKLAFLNNVEDSDLDLYNDTQASYKAGVSVVTVDSCGDLLIESVPNSYAAPYNTALVSATIASPLALPDLPAGMYIGIFIQRAIITFAKTPASDAQLLAVSNGYELPQLETINLNISWN